MINIIDIEASGLHFDSYPIEIAVFLNGKTQSWLIRPEPHWQYWCNTAQSLHGITRAQLFSEGLPAQEIIKQLEAFLTDFDGVLYSDADRWDIDWIDTLYFSAKHKRPFQINSIYDLLDSTRKQKFDKFKAKLAKTNQYRHHRAESDVKMINEAYRMTLSDI